MTEPWREHLSEMERAIEAGQAAAAVRAWHCAHAAAMDQPGWQSVVHVAEAARRIGAVPGFGRAGQARARETYWLALFRAHREGSLTGVLRTAEGFCGLGDRNMVEQCIRIAESLAARDSSGPGRTEHVRALAEDLLRRYFGAPSGREGAPSEREAQSPA
jgi:hypothetical protein